MDVKERRLDELLKDFRLGGRFPHESGPRSLALGTYLQKAKRFVADLAADTRRLRDLPELVVGMAASKDINAIAIRDIDNTYYIGICQGVFDGLIDIFLRLLSRPEVFTWLVDVPGADARIPSGLTRRQAAAIWMASTAADFLMYHEIRHVIGGHLDYRPRVDNASFIMEATSSGGRPEVNLVLQAFEHESDTFAAVALLGCFFSREPLSSLNLPFLDGYDDNDKPRMVLNLVIGAILGLLRLFGGTLKDYDQWDQDNHPPAEVRRVSIAGYAAMHMRDWGQTALANNRDAIKDSVMAVDITLREILGLTPWSEEWLGEFRSGGKFEQHSLRLNSLLVNELRPQLEKERKAYWPTNVVSSQ